MRKRISPAALLVNDLDTKVEGSGVSVCPGPNLAYFSKTMKLKEMVGHIYNKANVITSKTRPNMFMKELNIYMEYLKKQIKQLDSNVDIKQYKYLTKFTNNMLNGVTYYQELFKTENKFFSSMKITILKDLETHKLQLKKYNNELITAQ